MLRTVGNSRKRASTLASSCFSPPIRHDGIHVNDLQHIRQHCSRAQLVPKRSRRAVLCPIAFAGGSISLSR